MYFNWWAITVISIWFCASIGSIFTKNSAPFDYALSMSILVGLGWFFTR